MTPDMVRILWLLLVCGLTACSESSGGAAGGGGTSSGVGGAASSGNASDLLCGRRPGGSAYDGAHTLRFESTEPPVIAQIARRRTDETAPGESLVYALDAFALVMDGTTHCVTDGQALDYANSHHNWRDRATVTIDGVHYELAMDYSFEEGNGWRFTLTGTRGDQGVLKETVLTRTGGPLGCSSCPAPLPVYISEFQARNESGHTDEQGEPEPWIEIYNPSSGDWALAGWSLSNALRERRLWTFPDVIVPRHGNVVVFADGETEEGPLHASFSLEAGSGEVILTAPDGTTDGGFVYGASDADQSFIADYKQGTYVLTAEPTPGAKNPNMLD